MNNNSNFRKFVQMLILIFGILIPSSISSMAQSNDYLIVPGKSLGKISLSMERDQVSKTLGNPAERTDKYFKYKSSKSADFVKIYFKEGRVAQIDFTSPSFLTKGGNGVKNHEDPKFDSLFDKWIFRWRFINLKFTLKSGGLTFYDLNCDSADNPDYPNWSYGVVHPGKAPLFDFMSGDHDEYWKPWNGKF